MVPRDISNKFDQAKIRLYLRVSKKNNHIAFKGIYVVMRALILVGVCVKSLCRYAFASNLIFCIRIGGFECYVSKLSAPTPQCTANYVGF